jgi:hypothetical protein
VIPRSAQTLSEEDELQAQTDAAAAYEPSEAEQAAVRLVTDRQEYGRQLRRPHEGQWYVNGAFVRGHQFVEWSSNDSQLVGPPTPRRRVRLPINRIQPKTRARLAKFLKNRPVPVVVPATTDLEDRLDARATTKALDFIWRKLQLERAYGRALRWASITGHGYWWFNWDERALARVALTTSSLSPEVAQAIGAPPGEDKMILTLPVGEVSVEVGSPFELVVADPTLSDIGSQPWIIRSKRRVLSELKERYAQKASAVIPDGDDTTAESAGDRYAQQLGRLSAHGGSPTGASSPSTEASGRRPGEPWVLVHEYFERPSAKYRKGRYMVVAGGVLLKTQDELPYFPDQINPYPCVDFADFEQAGQYFGTTIVEQLVPLQREYNAIRGELSQHLRLMIHPKLLVTTAHNLQPGTWTNAAGEVIVTAFVPGLQPPVPWMPPPISKDAWAAFDLLKTEIEDISQIFPETEGKIGGSASGFQTNLLQEATDAVHGPDIRAHELSIEEAAYKLRRLMKLGYKPARLLTVTGRDLEPESFEFHKDDIDESADIVVQAGSALPTLKAAKMQAVMEMWSAGLLGDPADPAARQRALSMLEMGSNEEAFDSVRKDEEFARFENENFKSGAEVDPPEFFENHDVHYRVHTDALKSASSRAWPIEAQTLIREHIIRHVAYVNPQAAVEHAMRYGFKDLAMSILNETAMAAQSAALVGGAAPVAAPAGGDPGAPPPEGAPPGPPA